MAQQARQHDRLAGSARLVLVQGASLLHPERAVFDAMLAGVASATAKPIARGHNGGVAGADRAPIR